MKFGKFKLKCYVIKKCSFKGKYFVRKLIEVFKKCV
ncbi:hypothetical protein CLJU_c05590 [Clostridium ljungdahlii DSM 13528]|uniref:Uncharacterized protein n=1 Tax=Clostridium ljungdahlii (strain ATCC 55383 / DSM 13528 / PETC) TaxID=748727 RepID=D8GN17_CLOLD|nr:hypothetical protein CLJU_c05590 [Clostridium ljungdahlii DSM 13528]